MKRKLLLFTLQIFLFALFSHAQNIDKVWDFGTDTANFPVGAGILSASSNYTVNTLTVNWGTSTSSTAFGVIEANSATWSGPPEKYVSVNRFKFGGASTVTGNLPTAKFLSFPVNGPCIISIWFKSGGTSSRTLNVSDGTNSLLSFTTTDSATPFFNKINYAGAAGTIYVYATNAFNIYKLSVTYPTTWNGTSWSDGVPTINKAAIINGNYSTATNGSIEAKTLTVDSGSLLVDSGTVVTVANELINNAGANGIVFENNSKLLQNNNATNFGVINLKRNSASMALLDYTLWSSPVAAQNLFAFSPNTVTTPTTRFYSYTTATNSYDNTGITNTSTFTAAKGYAVRAPNTFNATPAVFTGTFTGVPNNGNVSIALDATTPGFNLVGNPYPSPINASAFVTANASLIDGTLYFFSHNAKSNGTAYEASSGGTGMQYATWNGTGATAAASGVSNNGQNTSIPTGVIQTGQGFIVKATTAGNLSFTNAMRVGAATNTTLDPFFKMVNTKSASATIATEKHRLWLDLTDEKGEGLSQLLVGYVDGATNEVDNLYDGEEFGAPKTSLTSQLNGKSYTIQGRALPFTDTDRVPLAFKAATNGTYTIALSKTDGIFASNQDVFLKDNATGSVTNLKNGGYTFSASAGTVATRFELAYSKVAIEAALNTPVTAVKKQGIFQISTNGAILKEITVFDIQGNQVLQQQEINSTSSSLTGLSAARGVLILKVTTDNNQTQTIKIIN